MRTGAFDVSFLCAERNLAFLDDSYCVRLEDRRPTQVHPKPFQQARIVLCFSGYGHLVGLLLPHNWGAQDPSQPGSPSMGGSAGFSQCCLSLLIAHLLAIQLFLFF